MVEEAMVKGFPFEIPKEYADRPLLLVSMKVEMNQGHRRKVSIISHPNDFKCKSAPSEDSSTIIDLCETVGNNVSFAGAQGRATLEMRVKCKDTPEGPQTANLIVVLDGYNAPVSAGQFMDLVQRGFYNSMEIQR
jgi:hypothetical protein